MPVTTLKAEGNWRWTEATKIQGSSTRVFAHGPLPFPSLPFHCNDWQGGKRGTTERKASPLLARFTCTTAGDSAAPAKLLSLCWSHLPMPTSDGRVDCLHPKSDEDRDAHRSTTPVRPFTLHTIALPIREHVHRPTTLDDGTSLFFCLLVPQYQAVTNHLPSLESQQPPA